MTSAPSSRRRVAIDAMGSEQSPQAEVEGTVAAVRARGISVTLVGDERKIRHELRRHNAESDPRIRVKHATEIITMEDHPAQSVRRKKDSSLRVCFDLTKAGETDAVVSAGNSGAFLACGLFVMKRLEGVERPGVLATFPNLQGRVSLIDVGANVDVAKPEILVHFAVLAASYMRVLHKKSRPRVAVLSNGEEEHKGSVLTRGVHEILSRAREHSAAAMEFEYVGYCEGNDIFREPLDVIVTDGFTGNVILKTTEGIAEAMFELIRQELTASRGRKLLASLLKPAFKAIKLRTDWAEHGGAPLLGVDGVAVLCHGASNARALENAIYLAETLAEAKLAPVLEASVKRHAPLWARVASVPDTGEVANDS